MVVIMGVSSKFPDTMIFDYELSEEALELLKRQYQKVKSIGKMKMDSIEYQLFLDKYRNVYFPKGTLLHRSNTLIDTMEMVSKDGILAPEFLGKNKDSKIYYCVDFYKVSNDILLSNYDEFNNSLLDDEIAYVVNPTSKIGGLLYYDLLDNKFDNNPMVRNIVSQEERNIFMNENDKLSSILVGVPSNAISGIVIGDKVLLDDVLMDKIKTLFPNAYLISSDGIIIRDYSNVIKANDYEKLSLEYAKEKVKNKFLANEYKKTVSDFKKSKKDFLNYITAVKNSTTYFEQASIYNKMGVRIPSKLIDKLSSDERKILNIEE